MIAIIDYGMGNLYSVHKAFTMLGAETVITSDASVIENAEKVILPGVGAFGDCMKNLVDYKLVEVIRHIIKRGTPFLGICLGLQLLFESSEEDPEVEGLKIFPGVVRKIEAPGFKIPHMGWNSLKFQANSRLFAGMPANSYVYFVHSYHAVPKAPGIITAVANYGGTVTAAVGYGNVQAVQFHPEKSSSVGLKILANFKELKL
ncbi:MAG: imidazole glycerol phosphate synthase subunit HisH [Veillonellaceae bacterium]|jgi:glutamine amidotransferase|nr:imidazole glycerol phosphate synthase subunit HisH [Veillonellaceae bacterium]